MYKKVLVSLLLVGILSVVSSCEDHESSVPSTVVNFSFSLQQSPYSFITTPGQYLTVQKSGSGYVVKVPGQPEYKDGKVGVYLGFGGLIIGYPAISMSTTSQYVAYDLACPTEASNLRVQRLSINANREAKCAKCGTTYDLDSGFPKEGAGKERLRTYAVYVTHTGTGISLSIRN